VKNKVLVLMSILIAGNAIANVEKVIPFDSCFSSAAKRFDVNKVLLAAIAKTESSFNPQAIGKQNDNGSFDIGLMQINSSWFPKLKSMGIERSDLLDSCTSIYVGAWILSHNIKSHGNTWRAVGAYNARTPVKQVVYVKKVMAAATYIQTNYQH
jgi:soluble lytic murein transglycosylase-like protein